MKAKTINVQITRCPRQYESIRIGGEWSVDNDETEEEVLDKALQMLNGYYEELTQPKQVAKSPEQVAQSTESGENSTEQEAQSPESGENSHKKKLSYDSQSDRDVLQAIINKMEREGVTIETVLKYYEPDDACLHCLQLVSVMNK